MKNRIISVIVVMLFAMFLLGFANYYDSETEQETKVVSLEEITYQFKPVELVEVIEPTPSPTPTPDPYDVARYEVQERIREIDDIKDKQEWFISYKEIINEYKEWIDPPETIYDVFSEEELRIFFGVVQAEIGDEWTFIQKVNVANVILNRLYSNQLDFAKQDTLTKVLTADQFCTIRNGRYKKVEVSEITILACEYAFMIEDTTDGALFFDNNGVLESNYEKMFNDEAHNFYKIREEENE